MKNKLKLSITLDPETVDYIDRQVKKKNYQNRSQCVEYALKLWSQQQRVNTLNEGIATYYRSQTSQDIQEDDVWNQLGDEGVGDW